LPPGTLFCPCSEKPPVRRSRFNRTNLDRLALPPGDDERTRSGRPVRQRIYWDDRQPGFGIMVSRTARSFVVQKDVRGRSVRVTIGRYPTWTPERARKRAQELLVEMDRGEDPNARKRQERARGITLGEAVELHVDAMRAKECAQVSIDEVRASVGRYLNGWTARGLAGLRRDECARRHRIITERHGPYVANRAMAVLRACYNSARRVHAELPANPVEAVTFNPVRRRREPIAWEDLPAWGETVASLRNPMRRDLQLFLLLTGLRSTDGRTVRWEHVDFEAGTIHRPKPKGGEDRAFTIPLSEAVLGLLRRRREENAVLYPDDGGWVFPTRGKRGRVQPVNQVRELRYEPGTRRKVPILPSPHRLRDTFVAAAVESGVGAVQLKALINHSLPANPDDVTQGYYRPSMEALRDAIEKTTRFLIDRGCWIEDAPVAQSDRASGS